MKAAQVRQRPSAFLDFATDDEIKMAVRMLAADPELRLEGFSDAQLSYIYDTVERQKETGEFDLRAFEKAMVKYRQKLAMPRLQDARNAAA